jgi:acyl carrier protein
MEAQSNYAVHPAAAQRIKEIAAGIFQIDASSIDLAMGPDDIERWDSLNHLRLITETESAFSVRLTMNQIQQIKSLADLVRFVAEGSD